MAVSDAFVVVGDWLSEHFFTSDATKESFHALVLARRKQWDAAEGETSRTRFTSERAELERRIGALADAEDHQDLQDHQDPDAASATPNLAEHLLRVLGYRTGEFTLAQDGPLLRVSSTGIEGPAPLAIVQARPAESVEDAVAKDEPTLATPYVTDTETFTSTARLLSALVGAEDGPQFALVLAGRWCIVAEASRWAEGRYLGVDLQLVAERNDAKRGGEIDRALTILEAASLAPDAEGGIWWSTALEESVRHTVGVSEDLREGVRRSIEIIANEVVARRAAAGLEPLPKDQAQPLAVQSLRYLYRILFLLYAEASPELGVLPSGAAEYDSGYSVDRLRELTLVDLTTGQARNGTHLYESLRVLTELVDRGPRPSDTDPDAGAPGLDFQPLRADLFRPEATAHIDQVRLGNAALQQVLQHLLLSKEQKGRARGFISYAELGINQLGAVYEGLMSYTGFFAEEDLYEVAPGGDASKGSWVVPVDRSDHLAAKDFVRAEDPVTGELKAVRHAQGTFVYRLSGRERQQSASYYTPEVLTRFTVQQALEELLDQGGTTTSAEDILTLTVCEPALGSGAFAIEAVDQLAREYLARRQEELGRRIDPEDYPHELQKVKAHIALHQVYGVDLNATAVELAEVSLWLSTMVTGLQAPWFGLRLRRGNSLIGARRSVYAGSALRKDRSWMKAVPEDRPLSELHDDGSGTSGCVFHFLLPSEGWGSGVEVPKQVRDLVPDEVKALRAWRLGVRRKLSAQQVRDLEALTQRAEKLWALALRRLTIAEQQSGRDLDLWGREVPATRGAVTREQIEESLADQNGAYRRLRRVMDAWCALWFWPLTETEVAPPSMEQWIDALQMLLGVESTKKNPNAGTESLAGVESWAELDDYELWDRAGTNAVTVEKALEAHPWLAVCERVAQAQGFFHWELDFVAVFARGGFDLQVGNPPWVRPDVEIELLLAEGDPWWQLAHKPSVAQKKERRPLALAVAGVQDLVVSATADTKTVAEYLSSVPEYPNFGGRPDLYRAFMGQVWRHAAPDGIAALIHPESHFTDDKTHTLRRETYRRLRRHWQFINELRLFEIDHHVSYGIHVYGQAQEVDFVQAAGLFHPDTVGRSLVHDGSGEEPGFKHEGRWDQRPHAARIQQVTADTLALWSSVTDPDATDPSATRMLYTVNSAAVRVLGTTAQAGRIGDLELSFSTGWNETTDRTAGRFVLDWGPAAWKDAILQGPHLHVSTPLVKEPNETMRNNLDWSAVDHEALAPDALPVTSYTPAGDRKVYNEQYTRWGEDREYSARDFYRVAWRRMAANTGERTLIPAVIPPGSAHVDPVHSGGFVDRPALDLAIVSAVLGALLSDFSIRAAPKGDIRGTIINRLPMVPLDHPLLPALALRTLQLNCLTDAYADLWNECWDPAFAQDEAILPRYGSAVVGKQWTAQTPLRRAEDRRNAQVEIDSLVALMLGVDVEDLCTVYRTTFAVLHGYDQDRYTFDANGRLVPTEVLSVWKKKGERMTQEERTAVHPGSGVAYEYELPFATRDREDDFRAAYAEFQRRLKEAEG
ncbi:Eco57I restriction-modification methylase domain-containing protein [Micrococcus lylae]|uniref:site-specific DNA-methyltransferase (adenine-specific) n=1 Tax=Micrococcus lylae TaxID=1273 RepID=A0ABY2K231_9MICC|nr:DNA methyltransferase [Micrococcus lylae]TFH98368.1 class I SAM-dependent DNA methyltransferase [Micrococcus lylae]